MRKTDDTARKRPIRCAYYQGKDLVRNTASLWAHKAASKAGEHLTWDDYKADRAEVYDLRTGELLAVLRMRMDGHNRRKLETIFEKVGTKIINSEKEPE